ncbi:helix-turn-helix domain-containing protein [Pseudoxanthomonas sp. LH2527]|uniref:helix-turn-helix domain-containing protein n=1 Tax=Pseudoxanthomonas sp. LH2527 TaxID=2923249 RepID=UPI001F147879|nr:helix-turn-helix domain-containing protein [Pseudoxanthomonas sp. LH2527]MCH6484892.1 helix-turn-helix domain-containing protein [Pseudoxanthomonas sp. LH2527]
MSPLLSRASVFAPAATLAPIMAMTLSEYPRDRQRVAIPQVEAQIVVRFGPTLPDGVDVHAMGPRTQVQRKFIRGGQRAVLARLRPGTYEAALGISAAELQGTPVPLDALWGHAPVHRLREQLAAATDTQAASALLEAAVSARVSRQTAAAVAPAFLHAALERLQIHNVGQVARDLAVSERHLRRVLRDTLGLGPKTYARLQRFAHAVRLAQSAPDANWSAIAADTGYYDQAHLIADFHAIASRTPRALLTELREADGDTP